MGIDPSKIQNQKFQAALKAATQTREAETAAKAYTLSSGLLKWSTIKSVIVPGMPVAKPRMTQRDQWQKRPAVLRYRDYCDRIRAAWVHQFLKLPERPDGIMVIACLPVSPSWPKYKRAEAVDCGHQLKPDGDNILKAVCDALFEEDSHLWVKWVVKFWCAEENEATHISVLWYE